MVSAYAEPVTPIRGSIRIRSLPKPVATPVAPERSTATPRVASDQA